MKRDEFEIGEVFWCGGKRWRTTDIGTRVIVAIGFGDFVKRPLGACVSHEDAQVQGWFNGPPYALEETVFDENDMQVCTMEEPGEE